MSTTIRIARGSEQAHVIELVAENAADAAQVLGALKDARPHWIMSASPTEPPAPMELAAQLVGQLPDNEFLLLRGDGLEITSAVSYSNGTTQLTLKPVSAPAPAPASRGRVNGS